jgi:hypothetical protein
MPLEIVRLFRYPIILVILYYLKNMWRGVQTGGSGVRDESVRVWIEEK